MTKWLVIKWHDNSAVEFGKCDKANPVQVVEKLQQQRAKDGRKTGLTWQVVEGSIADALVATKRL